MKRKTSKKPSKLRGKAKVLASRFIAEEMETHKYPRKQAIAIGISRAKRASKVSHTKTRLTSLLKKYK